MHGNEMADEFLYPETLAAAWRRCLTEDFAEPFIFADGVGEAR
jgi:hypothetical protein